MRKDDLLNILPVFQNENLVIKEDQGVNDIIKEVLKAHGFFSPDYDLIYNFFDVGSIEAIARKLFNFCKENILYEIESEDLQTTRSPSAILALSHGDCKHYAGFIGGVLGAINRNTNRKINWVYRFAGYSYFSDVVAHVFIVVFDKGREIWVDPVLSYFDQRSPGPVFFIDKKISEKMLTRISGMSINDVAPIFPGGDLVPVDYSNVTSPEAAAVQMVRITNEAPDTAANDLPPDLKNAIEMLLYYGIIDENLNWDNEKLVNVFESLQESDAAALNDAVFKVANEIQNPSLGNIFGDIWNAVKTVAATPIRAAFLGLVSLNVFNLGAKIYASMYNTDGSIYQKGFDKVHAIWYKFGGKISNLEKAAKNGMKKKPILGGVPANPTTGTAAATGVTAATCAIPGVGTWICTASAIIVAMLPILASVLKAKSQDSALDMYNQQAALNAYNASAGQAATLGSSINKFLPYLLILGAGAFIYFDLNKKRR
jgi:hypothetical protein